MNITQDQISRLRKHVVSSTSDTMTPVKVHTGGELATLPRSSDQAGRVA